VVAIVSGLLVPALIFVIRSGGVYGMQEWLASHDTTQRAAAERCCGARTAIPLTRTGFVSLLLRGLDQWGELSAQARERSQAVRFCVRTAIGSSLARGHRVLWFFGVDTTLFGASCTLLWSGRSLFVWRSLPILWIALHTV